MRRASKHKRLSRELILEAMRKAPAGGATALELAEAIGCSASNLRVWLRSLLNAGLVSRRALGLGRVGAGGHYKWKAIRQRADR